MCTLFQMKVSPRRIGFYAGALGAFGAASYGYALVVGSAIPRNDAVYLLAMSVLLLASGIVLWRGTSRGWWLAWAAMLATSLSGFVVHAPEGWPPDQFPPLFFSGFLLAAGGIFFAPLAHRDVYGPCFVSVPLPHAAIGAAPALLIIAGAAMLIVAGGAGLMAGPFVFGASIVLGRWLYSPLWAVLSGRRAWHAV